MNHQFHDPPYARLENSKDEEMESEEGYETIPASERQNHNGNLVFIVSLLVALPQNYNLVIVESIYFFF